jgi:hypothetical protein
METAATEGKNYFGGDIGQPTVLAKVRELHSLMWDELEGRDSTSDAEANDYRFLVDWAELPDRGMVSSIRGDLRGVPYYMKFVGLSDGLFDLTLPDKRYRFSSSLDYGHFSTPGTVYLTQGSACYSHRWHDEAVGEFMVTPFANHRGRLRDDWIMDTVSISEVCEFLDDLISCVRLNLNKTENQEVLWNAL